MLVDQKPTLEECMGWLAEREDALSALLNDLGGAQWRGEDRHEQVCAATWNVIVVRDIQQRLHATTAPLTPTGEVTRDLLAVVERLLEPFEGRSSSDVHAWHVSFENVRSLIVSARKARDAARALEIGTNPAHSSTARKATR